MMQFATTRRQRGISLVGLIFGLALLAVLALVAMRTVPVYIEYYAIKRHVEDLGRGTEGVSPRDIQSAFDKRAGVDDITAVKGSDLEVSKEGDVIVISVSYERRVSLFSNVSLSFTFDVSSAH